MNVPPNPLPRIATPPRHRWRIFCAEGLPRVIFVLGVVGVFALWRQAAATPTLVAEAEIIRAEVKAIRPGTLTELKVKLLQPVAAGDVIARLHPTDPAIVAASLAVIRAEIELLRSELEPALASRQRLVETLTPSVEQAAAAAGEPSGMLTAALRVQEEKLRLTEAQLAPIVLTAPIAGFVSAVGSTPGATLVTGDLIATITAERASRLIGFLRQPLPHEARAGMRVELRARNAAGQRIDATIGEVGHALEPVSPTVLALFNRTHTPEIGLRVHIAIPPGFAVRPGEQVDVTIPRI